MKKQGLRQLTLQRETLQQLTTVAAAASAQFGCSVGSCTATICSDSVRVTCSVAIACVE